MNIIEMFKKGTEQLHRKKRLRTLKTNLISKREELSEQYLDIGKMISEMDVEKFADFEEVNSMKNVLDIIKKLESENLILEEKIDITKEDYNHQIESYTPLIAELKENLSIPTSKLANLKESILELKKELREQKDTLKDKEAIFKDTQERLENKSEEDDLDDEKTKILESDYQRLQRELLEITHEFELKTDEHNELKDHVKIVEEEIKTAEEQINTYKKEIGRLKKEKLREIDAIKKMISFNKNSILSRKKELDGIYKNIGNLSYSNKVLPEEFQERYDVIDDIHANIKQTNLDRQALSMEIDKEDSMVLVRFFFLVLAGAFIVVFSFWGAYVLMSTPKKPVQNNSEINNIACNKAEILLKKPKNKKGPFTVKSQNLFSRMSEDKDSINIVFSADYSQDIKTYKLEVFNKGKSFSTYHIKSKKDTESKDHCLIFYMD